MRENIDYVNNENIRSHRKINMKEKKVTKERKLNVKSVIVFMKERNSKHIEPNVPSAQRQELGCVLQVEKY